MNIISNFTLCEIDKGKKGGIGIIWGVYIYILFFKFLLKEVSPSRDNNWLKFNQEVQ